MPKLTQTFVERLPQTKFGTSKFWDSEIRGLVLFVGKRTKTWYFQRDVGGKTRRTLIGRFPIIEAPAARQTAMTLALEWARGAGKVTQFGAPTLKNALDAYLSRPRLRSETHKKSLQQMFDLHLSDWMNLPLDEISKRMVVERHLRLKDRPSSANHLLKYFRTIWNHARRVHDLPESPTMAIEWFVERPAANVVEDLKKWRQTVNQLENPIHRIFYEFLLFTGLRKSEALTLEWKNVHDDHIHLPVTKNGRSFDLPITQRHHTILFPLRNIGRAWVFPSSKSPKGHVTNPERMEWGPHMHRRTFATVAMEAGVLEEIVGRLLNHTPISITGQRYAKPSLDALRPSMDQIVQELARRTSSE